MTTWLDFATALLTELAAPDTQPNIDALLTWMAGEQPPGEPNADFNPLNIQSGGAPHSSLTPGGQYNFPSFEAGVDSTASFLQGSYYAGIRLALTRGESAVQTVAAIQASPWAASHYGGRLVALLSTVQANRATYENGLIAGAGGPTTPTEENPLMPDDATTAAYFGKNLDGTPFRVDEVPDQITGTNLDGTKPKLTDVAFELGQLQKDVAAIAAHLGVTLPTT